MSKLDRQQENINNLLLLAKENPDLEIVPMVATECVFSDDFSSWMAEWGNASIDEYYCSDERIYFKSKDFDELVEDFIDNNFEEYSDLSDEELEKLAEKTVNGYEWVKAIVVRINEL